MLPMHDPATNGHDLNAIPAAPAQQKSVNRGDQRRTLLGLVSDVQDMAQAMQDRLMINGKLKDGIAIREGKEAVSSISSLLSLILRHKDALDDVNYQLLFDDAVVEVLSEMDEAHKTDYAERLQQKLDAIA